MPFENRGKKYIFRGKSKRGLKRDDEIRVVKEVMPRETPNGTMESVLYRSMSLYARCALHTAHATDYKLLDDWRKLVVVAGTWNRGDKECPTLPSFMTHRSTIWFV